MQVCITKYTSFYTKKVKHPKHYYLIALNTAASNPKVKLKIYGIRIICESLGANMLVIQKCSIPLFAR